MELRRLRLERDLTQEGLAGISGVARPTIHRMENGQQKPRKSTVRKLARALEVEPSDIAPDLFPAPGSPPPGVPPTPEIQRKFEPYITTLARRISRSPDDVEDLAGAGREGLIEACQKFRDTGGMDFEPWVKTYVRNRILDEAKRYYEGSERTYGFEETLPPEWEGDIPDLGTMQDDE